jgi:putative transposase
MSDYRRYFVAGGTYFFTLVTYNRRPIFAAPDRIEFFRESVRIVKAEMPFDIHAAVVLHDHVHFIWSLPPGDAAYSTRIGRIKIEFTRRLRGASNLPTAVSASRRKHRESDVWQRRFWEHTIQNENEFDALFDYIHYNPVKHGYVSCPHLWNSSSFSHWVAKKICDIRWGCNCEDRQYPSPNFSKIQEFTGE